MRTTVNDVLTAVAKKHGLTFSDLIGPCRRRPIAWPRQEAMYRIFIECPHISFPEMGRRIGWRDHTTCIHGVRVHCERIGLSYEEAQAKRRARQVSIDNERIPVPLSFDALCAGYAARMREAARV